MARIPEDDEAALRWDDVDDASYVDPARPDDPALPSEGDAAVAAATSTESSSVDPAASAAPSRRRSATAVITGIFGGVYLMYSVGWIIGVAQNTTQSPSLFLEIMYQFAEFLAIIASALWFAAVLVLTRHGKVAARFGWLALGSLVLVPWPFLLGVIS